MGHDAGRTLGRLREASPLQAGAEAASTLRFKYRERLFERYFSDGRLVGDDRLPDRADRVWYADREERVAYTDPRESGVPAEFGAYTASHRPERRYVCELPACTLDGPAAVGFTDDGALVLPTASGDERVLHGEWPSFVGHLSTADLLFRSYTDASGRGDPLPECVLPLVPFYDRYYYHWILEYLPKLRALERYESETGVEPALLVEADPPSFVVESLSLLGYPPERLVEWTPGTRRVGTLVVTNHRPHLYRLVTPLPHSLDDYRWLRERVRAALDEAPSESGRRLYVSRQGIDRGRRVRNHEAVMRALEPLGFRSVAMESLPFREQVRLVTEAETILGPHGAGLVNALFGTDPTVVELLPETDLRPHFYTLADVLGFGYASLVTDADERTNLTVDVDELRATLDEAGVS